jgi:hypothetical protein
LLRLVAILRITPSDGGPPVNEPLGTARRSVGPTGAADSAQPRSEFAARVLLADDHAVVRQGLKALLEKRGLEVVGEAADGQAAVELAKRLRPEVAVLDIVMPLGSSSRRKRRKIFFKRSMTSGVAASTSVQAFPLPCSKRCRPRPARGSR